MHKPVKEEFDKALKAAEEGITAFDQKTKVISPELLVDDEAMDNAVMEVKREHDHVTELLAQCRKLCGRLQGSAKKTGEVQRQEVCRRRLRLRRRRHRRAWRPLAVPLLHRIAGRQRR